MSVRFARALAVVALVLALGVAVVSRREQGDGNGPRAIPAGKWVTVRPPFGHSPSSVRTYMTTRELSSVSTVQAMIDGLARSASPSFRPNHVRWFVEPSARGSATFGLQRDVMYALDRVIESELKFEFIRSWQVSIIIARTRAYVTRVLQDHGCVPDLGRTNGIVLMGAAVCDRHIIVSNLTGFLFVVRADQAITRSMETRREPSLSRIPYRIVMRNISGLAHEYAHIWRAAAQNGLVRPDEPAWFSEGFAEFWSGVAATLAYPAKGDYLAQHVLHLRDFVEWSPVCPQSLSHYRTGTPLANGCEYFLGMIAIEYLYARYSSLALTQDAFSKAASYSTFAEGFKATYGISIDDFEKEADGYINDLRRAEAYTRSLVRAR